MRRQAMIRAFISLFCGCIGVFRFGVVADSRLKPIEQVQESRIPDTPVGHHLAGWLKAYDSGDIEVVRRFVAEHYDKTHFQNGPNPVNFFFSSLYPETGSLVFNRVLYANEHKIIALVQSALTEAWYRLIIRTADGPPHGMFIQGIGGDQEPEGIISVRKLTDADISSQLREYLNKLATADAFSGTILVARNGKPVFGNAYGLADKERNEPNRIDTKFQLASLSKMFTGIGVCQLAEQGKLSFTDPIIKHLPDYPNRAVAEKVTIHHLLSHTAGLGDFLQKKEYLASEGSLRKSTDFFPFFASDPLSFDPGEDQEYSNADYIVLGAIIERLSGQSFQDYVREHILRPASMLNTGYNETGQKLPNMAIAYQNGAWNPQYQPIGKGPPIMRKAAGNIGGQGSATGGGYSTAEDLLKFELALRRHKLLNERYTEMLLTGEGELGVPGIVPTNEAYGFHHDTLNAKHIVGHNGGSPGVSSRLDIYLDQEYTVVLLSNYDPPMGSIVANHVRKMLTEQGHQQRPRLTGEFRTHRDFHSRFLSIDRDIVVYLPPGYNAEKTKRYPVLYLQDGQSLFADVYGRMLIEELKPFIDSQYRTRTDAANTGLGGSSYGGLLTVYLGLKYPAVFGKLAVLSPAVWWNNKMIIAFVQALTSKPALHIWMDCGTAEGVQMKNDVRALRDAFVAKGWNSKADLNYVEIKGAVHNHDSWAQRVDPFLRYLFPKE